jgi:hypothetical protein
MRTLTLAALTLCLVACGKKDAPTAGNASTSTSPSAPLAAKPSASASAAAAPARKKLTPQSVAASSEYKHGAETHPVGDAFDGSYETAWIEDKPGPGVGEWIEAKLAAPQKIRRLRIANGFLAHSSKDLFHLNARAKTLKVIFDGKESEAKTLEIGEGDEIATLDGLDVTASSVRFVVGDAFKGGKWDDLCITEAEIWGEPSSEPSGGRAAPSLAELKATLAKLTDTWKASGPEASKWLTSVGFTAAQVKDIAYVRVNRATLFDAQLDADEGQEHVAVVSTFNQADAPNHTYLVDFYVFVDDEKAGLGLLGRRAVPRFDCRNKADGYDAFLAADTVCSGSQPPCCRDDNDCDLASACKVGEFDKEKKNRCIPGPESMPSPELSFTPVHAGFADVVAKWKSTRSCEAGVKGDSGAFVATLEDGALRILAEGQSGFETDADGKEVKAATPLALGAEKPVKTLTVPGADKA